MIKIDRPDDVSHAELNAIVRNLMDRRDDGETRALPANRHERRRRAVIFEQKQIPLFELAGICCGWRDCQATHSFDELPDGWSNLICHATPTEKALFKVNVGGKPRPVLDLDGLAWRHDVGLCPDHTKMLADLLEAGADPLLSETVGRA